MPYSTVVAGTTITSAWGNANVRDQVVTPFASAAARSSAITSPVEGMVTHLNDTNCLGVYSGSVHSTIGPVHGPLTTWTPTVTQLGSVAVTVNETHLQRVGRRVWCQFYVTCTGTGTAANAVTIGGFPAVPGGTNIMTVGAGQLFDSSVGSRFPCLFRIASTTTLCLDDTNTTNAAEPRLGITNFAAALASGDTISGTFEIVAATDA